MTLYIAARVIHIVGALGMFTALGVDLAGMAALTTARTSDQARRALAVYRINSVLGPPTLALILIPGLYMATMWGWPSWARMAMLVLVTVMALGGAVSGRRMSALAKTLPAESGAGALLPPDIQRDVRDPMLRSSLIVRAFLVLSIVMLMTMKPALGVSLVVVSVAIVAGVALSAFLWSD
jgi:predicted integral membrane protein DUF2269